MKQYWQKKQGWFKSLFSKPAAKAFASVVDLLHLHMSENNQTAQAIVTLLKAVLWADGPADEQTIEYFEKILEQDYSRHQIAQLSEELKSPQKVNIETACKELQTLDEEQKIHLLESLVSLGMSNDNYSDNQRKIVAKAANLLNITKVGLEELEDDVEQRCTAQNRILKSSAGIIVALIVLGVFILTATLLKSVLFGLILAYVFLPLEKFYERKLEGKGLISGIFKFFASFKKPFKAVSRSMRRNKQEPEYTEEELARRKRKALIAKASTLTVFSFVIIVILVTTIVFSVSANYIAGFGDSVRGWINRHVKTEQLKVEIANTHTETEPQKLDKAPAETPQPPIEKTKISYVKKVLVDLEDLKPKLKEVPAVHWCLEQISKVLNDPETQKELLTALLKKSGGVFSFTAGILSSMVSFLLNALLAIFFFSLFLSKMAEFIKDNENQQKRQSEYLVRTVFNSKWLPAATETTVLQAQEIISQVISKMKTWLKGYLICISVDTVVYTTAFYFLGVPYAFLLAFVAALGLLLPYIGPIASAILTVLVTLAVGNDVTMAQLVLIVCTYLIQNGIVEQLFLYPAVIGESLGLTTLETIIVVLLGGIFAGITGMIFAIPTAAVLKYLIPKIYSCWE